MDLYIEYALNDQELVLVAAHTKEIKEEQVTNIKMMKLDSFGGPTPKEVFLVVVHYVSDLTPQVGFVRLCENQSQAILEKNILQKTHRWECGFLERVEIYPLKVF